MDYKDILAIALVVIVTVVVSKYFRNNPLTLLGDYIKLRFMKRG